ncbi:alpha/beta fold hydrolase [Plantactinospora sp. BB1]|uniref:alpha/beta fold hydrolase n=1 Tax=Plantactinospora sp. BB1 TaxID=2071627 RepID=UPI0018FE5B83|nr:alpha/beta fold hydrolase [Plantactinospora sp. BB1]
MRTAQSLFSTALVVTTLGLPVAVPDVAAATPSTDRPGTIDWSPCPEDETAQCGVLRVPLDWSHPSGPTIELALARRPATDPGRRIGSMQINPGGPGGSGRLMAIFGADRFGEEIRSRFDIVGIDPRGVGLSTPIRCSQDLLDQEPSFVMRSQADFDARLAFNARLRADCRARSGPIVDHADMLSVVRDMDHVRAVLGDRQLTFYGLSYGSLNAQQYAELFPDRVRAIVSDSNLDHSLGTTGFLDTQAASAQDSFDEFVRWSDRTPTSPLHGRDVRAFWHRLLDRVDRGEIPSPFVPDVALRPEILIWFVFRAFYGPEWSFLADFLVDLDSGDAQPWEPGPELPEETEYPQVAIFCNDWSLPVRDYREWARHLRRAERIAPDLRYSPAAAALTAACLGSPARIANPQHPLRVRDSATPLLVTNALHDPATGYNQALGVTRQLGRDGVLFSYHGWGHGVYGRSECTDDAIERYLIDRTLPARGAGCPAVEPPAEPSASRQSIRPPTTVDRLFPYRMVPWSRG